MDILTLGKIKKLKDALIASDLSTIEQIAVVNQALTQAIDVDVANALQQVSDDLADTQAAVGGDLGAILTSMDNLEDATNLAIGGIPATVANELSALGTAGYLNVGTGANQIVQLDSSGNLPAVGAASLTGIEVVDVKPWRIMTYSGQWMQDQNTGNANTGYGSNGGSYTWTKGAGTQKIKIMIVGGGGGASGYGETGGAGGYAERHMDAASVSSTVTVTVGNRGGGSGYAGCAGTGGSSSFGGYVSANGGRGANCNGQHTGGHGGHGTSGDITMFGGSGEGHSSGSHAGSGGSSYFGNGPSGGHNRCQSWHHGAPGGGGPCYGNGSGCEAATGAVIVYEYK